MNALEPRSDPEILGLCGTYLGKVGETVCSMGLGWVWGHSEGCARVKAPQ